MRVKSGSGSQAGQAGLKGRQALPVPDLVRQPLVRDDRQGAGAGVGQQVVL